MKPIRTGDIVGDYRVISSAGSGGMGAVYKIEHLITKRVEAMKLLPPGSSSDPDQLQRFQREIQVQARLHHPNIVALYNAVHTGNSIALVMEFVEGKSLQQMLESGALPIETAIDFANQILAALAYAHASGVIHRDVAPANIIVTPGLVAKLTDFGLARGACDLRLSTSGVPLGSPWYMSPEQIRGLEAPDARTDLYALGAVLHEMLTGVKLFDAESAFAVMRAHVEQEPALPSARNPKVPPELDQIVLKAVAKDPALRFQSAAEFRAALESVVPGVKPLALPTVRKSRSTPIPWSIGRLRPSRAALALTLTPLVLLAAFGAIRFLPSTQRARPTPAAKSRPQAPVEAIQNSPLSPPVGAPPAPDSAFAIPPVPTPPPADPPQPAAIPRPRPPVPASATRRAAAPEHYQIRVTGSDVPASAAIPAPNPVQRHTVWMPEPPASKTQPAEPPEAAWPLAGDNDPSTDAGPAKPSTPGNRVVRALGKINPFRKNPKPDPAKSPLRQQQP